MKTLPIALTISLLIFTPMWLQHLISPDGGLIAIGGGKITEAMIFGDKKTKGMHPIVFHLCAIAGIAHFALTFLAIAATYFGDATVKKVTASIYAVWVVGILVVQYTHPWTGSPPESLMEMPAPLVFVIATFVAVGWFFDTETKPKKK